jgi:hypothetical protein
MIEYIRQLTFSFHPQVPVVVEFNASKISSDGGALLRHLDPESSPTMSSLWGCRTAADGLSTRLRAAG